MLSIGQKSLNMAHRIASALNKQGLKVIEKDDKACSICHAKGETGTLETEGLVFLHVVKPIRPEVLKYLEKHELELPKDRKYLIAGGYGSVHYDLEWLFLTEDQARKFPKYTCDNCVPKILKNLTDVKGTYYDSSVGEEFTLNHGVEKKGW